MRRFLATIGPGLAISLVVGLIYMFPGAMAWEEDTGLSVLFTLRGQRAAPDEVLIVALDDTTGRQLGLERETQDLPRRIYARLIDQLASAGAAVIAVDIFFRDARDTAQDAQLAAAIRDAGNVLLFGYLDQQSMPGGNIGAAPVDNGAIHIERFQPPITLFAEQAAAVAPFVLPKTPVRVSRFWTFHGANELAALPSAALIHYASGSVPELARLLTSLDSGGHKLATSTELLETISAPTALSSIHLLLKRDPGLAQALLKALAPLRNNDRESGSDRRLEALLTLYLSPDFPYLNFYGPPQSIATLPFADILNGDPVARAKVRGKAVFVGYAGRYQPKQKDGFYTVFSQPDGLDLSGVEIGATAFANLLNMETLAPLEPPWIFIIIVLYGTLITLVFRLLPTTAGIGTGLLIATIYFLFVYRMFADATIWLPWTVPLLVQTPLVLFTALVWNYREARQSRRQLRETFGHYLPGTVIDQLTDDRKKTLALGTPAFGVCLATDAEHYTSLAETMDGSALHNFLNRYYELLFAPVRARGGMISDVVGDAMLAIWSAPKPDAALRKSACEAALEITGQLDRAEQSARLPTRIGLHAGHIVLSHIGAIDHYEYRAVGDIVNTASRIEGLNKLLKTSILASGETIDGLEGLVTRELGSFHLKGKQQPVNLYEVICSTETVTAEIIRLQTLFAAALASFRQQSWPAAIEQFQAVLDVYPDDGPSQYYLASCRNHQDATGS